VLTQVGLECRNEEQYTGHCLQDMPWPAARLQSNPSQGLIEDVTVMETAPIKIANTTVLGELQPLEHYVPPGILAFTQRDDQKAVPKIAKSRALAAEVEWAARRVPTMHKLIPGDARYLEFLPSETVHLVVTSPPYWTLKSYPLREGQLGGVEDYDEFLNELDKVWAHVFRLLVPGGRLVIVVGDVCLSRRSFGRHVVFPLHAGIQERCRRLGFDNLAPIIWHKIANASLEVENGSSFLGKPYEPNAVIKNDIEFILFQRKPGGYRRPSLAARLLSIIPEEIHREWFQQIWTLGGASTKHHPAPFPLVLAERLVRMFSFAGDTVLDPFMGTGTTNIAAQRWGRHSIGIELEPLYFKMAEVRLRRMQLAMEFDSDQRLIPYGT
jgi:modification methylase